MGQVITYYSGGSQVAEEWGAAGFTRRNTDGTIAEQRPLTAEEAAALAAQDQAAQDVAVVASAQQQIAGLHAQVPDLHAQLAADIQAVTGGWDALTADKRTQIMLRILNGFGTAMTGLLDHATVTGAIPPTP